MKVRLKTTRDLETFFSDVVKDVPGLQRTETLIVLSSAKDTQTLVAPGA
jgi:Lrp/AsnC family transcriptional regulator, leucine-responsive regulatory protein